MSFGRRHILLILSVFFLFGNAYANKLGFVENKGQWHEDVFYRAELHGGYAYIDRQGFTMLMLEDGFYTKLHDWWRDAETYQSGNAHALKFNFIGADLDNENRGEEDFGTVTNYFLGNDSEKWASNVRTFERIYFEEIYTGVSVRYGSSSGHMKYDFIVASGADASQIRIGIDGAEGIRLSDGELRVQTSVGLFTELAPFAYQLVEGNIEPVNCEYRFENGVISYHFPDGYDETKELIIDPEIAFSTYVGSSSSNFGFTASYDAEGNLYAGAIVYGAFYPTTTGSFQFNFGNGTIDCGITKFSSDGTDLIYSTYLGGNQNEAPHSIVVNENNELYVYGTTSSLNFPISDDAYQSDFGGGTDQGGNGFQYNGGCDIFVTKFNADGSDIIGSTFVGGSGNDGLGTSTPFDFNYGDRSRGEIVVDDAGNAYVASLTRSGDFPIVNGYANDLTSQIGGIIFKLSPSLDNLIWSTYSGGGGMEAAFSLQLANDNSVYFTGGTSSTDLPTSDNAYQDALAGTVDGYIGHISEDGSTLLHCTYNGTNEFDQNYFVQIDPDGDVYVVGNTMGDYPVSDDVYVNLNSGQFVQKFSPDLTTSEWSTVVGTGNGGIDISPCAFLVSDCGQIYISGWGGSLNSPGGGTSGLPISNDAFQSNTDDSDFYIMVLDDDAESLVYATYFGGSQSAEHADGGTSRFDKNGTVYQAVCAGCGGNDDFPSQPGVWSQNNPSTNCNLGVFKFELSAVSAISDVEAIGDVICPTSTFELINLSVGADTFTWDFGDGNTSNEESPTHSYAEPGEYTITLYAEDSEGCLTSDETSIPVVVEPLPEVEITSQIEPICPGETLQLNAVGADSWQWFPPEAVSLPNTADPIFVGESTIELYAVGSNICGNDTAFVDVIVGSIDVSISDDEDICPGESTTLQATGGVSYVWSPSEGLSNTTISNPVASPEFTTAYLVTITTEDDCVVTETVQINVLPPPPTIQGQSEYVSCNGGAVQLLVMGGVDYSWDPPTGLSNANISNPLANPTHSMTYTATASNVCGSDELEVTVLVNEIAVSISTDSVVCYNTPFYLEAFGGDTYIWQPPELVTNRTGQQTRALIENRSVITVTGFDSLGCHATESVVVDIFPREIVRAGNDRIIFYGEEVMLETFSAYPIVWEDSPDLSCLNCNYPIASPLETTTFYATIDTQYGCREVDSVEVAVHGDLYVPNAFTPDGDGLNDIFKAKGIDIREFKMEIFNRWGERVFVSEDIDKGWNGACPDGYDYYCPPDMYQYIIVATEQYGELFELRGTVMLLR